MANERPQASFPKGDGIGFDGSWKWCEQRNWRIRMANMAWRIALGVAVVGGVGGTIWAAADLFAKAVVASAQ